MITISYYNKCTNPCYLLCTGPIVLYIGISLGQELALVGGTLMTIGGILILVYQINKGKKKKANIKSMYHQTNIIPKQNRSVTQETSEIPKTIPETIIKPELASPIEGESKSNKTLKTRISSCPKCGSVIPDDIQASFCGECGYKFN